MSVFGFTGELAEVPQLGWWTHLFNHQTHHRGQLTTVLNQQCMDIGSTDLPFMPRFECGATPGG
jgi:uncharacterized damage-inducible protein DinB